MIVEKYYKGCDGKVQIGRLLWEKGSIDQQSALLQVGAIVFYLASLHSDMKVYSF